MKVGLAVPVKVAIPAREATVAAIPAKVAEMLVAGIPVKVVEIPMAAIPVTGEKAAAAGRPTILLESIRRGM